MLRSRGLLVAVSIVLFVSGCGSDDEATPTETIEVTTTTEASRDYTQSDLDAALLAPGDLGTGFVAEGPDGSSDESSGCAALDKIGDQLEGAETKSEVTLSNQTSGDLVKQIISIDEDASADLSAFQDAIDACNTFSVDLQGQSVTFNAAPIDVQTIGDESEAGRFTTSIASVSVNVDYLVFRKGDALSAILTTSFDNGASSRIGDLGAKAADKLTK